MSKSAVALLAAIALGAGACGSDGGSSGGTTAAAPAGTATPTAAAAIALSLTDTGCDPVTLTAPAGAVTFNVDNARDAKAEFEILSATPKILTEEFLEPGASGSFTVNLVAGEYQVICGRPSDTRAALAVTGEGGGQQALTVDAAALDAATAAYAAYVNQQVDQLVAGTTELVTAVKGGDVAAAKALYAPVRRPWERIEPVAELFPDSDARHRQPRRRLQRPGRPEVHGLPPHREGPVGGRQHQRARHVRRPAPDRRAVPGDQRPVAADHPGRHGERGGRAHRGGGPDEDHRRGGALQPHRPRHVRRQRRRARR